MDGKLAASTSGFVACCLVPIMEGFQEKENMNIITKYHALSWTPKGCAITCSSCMVGTAKS